MIIATWKTTASKTHSIAKLTSNMMGIATTRTAHRNITSKKLAAAHD